MNIIKETPHAQHARDFPLTDASGPATVTPSTTPAALGQHVVAAAGVAT